MTDYMLLQFIHKKKRRKISERKLIKEERGVSLTQEARGNISLSAGKKEALQIIVRASLRMAAKKSHWFFTDTGENL